MARRIPNNCNARDYEFTLVATGGNKALFFEAFASNLVQRDASDFFGDKNESPKMGNAIYYSSNRGPSYTTPIFFIARDKPRGLELDIYHTTPNHNTIAFSHTMGLLTTPLLRAGYTISVTNRSEEFSEKSKGDVFL